MKNLSNEELIYKLIGAVENEIGQALQPIDDNHVIWAYKAELLSRLNRLAEAEKENKELKEKLTENHDWYCGCDHWNGANLATCAMCGRTPKESYPTT